jgi:hypothetical protein
MAAAPAQMRLPWPPDFPDAVIHNQVRVRDSHPDYAPAKGGDVEAALVLAIELVSDDAVQDLRHIVAGRPAVLLPVVAEETTGFNAIPDAMAQVLSRDLRLEAAAGEIVQTNKVGHTRAPAFQRIVTPATFGGRVRSGADYVLVDDHVGLGGTLANLRGFVEAGGGRVVAITALTESRDARRISLRAETLAMLRERHGKELDIFWNAQFGYGIACLTEARNLCRQPSLAAIEDFLAQAAIEARGRGLDPAAGRQG